MYVQFYASSGKGKGKGKRASNQGGDEVTRDELIIMLDYVEPEPAVPEEVAADDAAAAAAAAVTVDEEEEEAAAEQEFCWTRTRAAKRMTSTRSRF